MSSLPSSPGKMDLSALGGLKKRTLQPVPDAPEPQPAPEDVPVVEEPQTTLELPDAAEAAISVPDAEAGAGERVSQSAPAAAQVKIEPAQEEHSGHVTLYLPRELNQWLAKHHDQTKVSYPGIILNAISWAAVENRFAEIFAPVDSPIPAYDIFGRAPLSVRQPKGPMSPETRPVRIHRDHMKIIISLARTWTADNRNAFFTGVLSAYRKHFDGDGEAHGRDDAS